MGGMSINGAGGMYPVVSPFASAAQARQTGKPEDEAGAQSLTAQKRGGGILESANAEEDKQSSQQLTDEEQQEVQQLKQRDAEVRRHEQAHIAAGGQYVQGGATFEYSQGPDGRRYATGGEVSIDMGAARTPEATVRKAQIVRRAALAPAEPSGQDRQVAAAASQMETKARLEIAKQRQEEAASAQASEETAVPAETTSTDSPLQPAQALQPQTSPLTPPDRASRNETPYSIRAEGSAGPKKLDLSV